MSFNCEMLVLARVSQGITQTDLAGRLETSQGRIAKWEDGLTCPCDADVERLAAVLQFPASFFEYDSRSEPFGSCCLYHRKRQSLPAGLLNRIHARINIIGMGIDRMLKNVAMDSALTFPDMDVDEFGGPAKVACLLRQHWSMSRGPVKNLVEFVESAGGVVVPFDFETEKLDAVSLWPRGSRPMFFVNRHVPTDRWRFTLCHEVGHIVMHKVPSPTAEPEADAFASEFLMPADDIRDDLTQLTLPKAARLKLRWRTSMQAIIRRAHDTEMITQRKYRSLFTALSAAGYRKNEPGEVPAETPATLNRLIEFHKKKLAYTDEQLRELLFCVNGDQFQRRFYGEAKRHLRLVRE